jgi:hypothetical protein
MTYCPTDLWEFLGKTSQGTKGTNPGFSCRDYSQHPTCKWTLRSRTVHNVGHDWLLVISSIASKLVTPSNVRRLLILYCLQFWTVCDPMTQTTTVAAASFVCNVATVNISQFQLIAYCGRISMYVCFNNTVNRRFQVIKW